MFIDLVYGLAQLELGLMDLSSILSHHLDLGIQRFNYEFVN